MIRKRNYKTAEAFGIKTKHKEEAVEEKTKPKHRRVKEKEIASVLSMECRTRQKQDRIRSRNEQRR